MLASMSVLNTTRIPMSAAYFHMGAELFDHRLVRARWGCPAIDLEAVTDAVEVHIFEEAVDDHAVVAVGTDVVDVLLPVALGLSKTRRVDVRRFGQDDVGELIRVVSSRLGWPMPVDPA